MTLPLSLQHTFTVINTATVKIIACHVCFQSLSSIYCVAQLLKYSETVTQGKGHVLNMDNFIDTTNIEGRFEYSEWVRAYGKYLDEQLEVYHKIAFYQVWPHHPR